MKIILFTDSLGSGGAQRQLCGLSVLLKQKGYDVKIATYHDAHFYKSYLVENDIEHELIPDSSSVLCRIFSVSRYFKKEKPDWVIAYQETPSLVSCIIKILGAQYKLLVSERNTTQELHIRDRIRFNLYRIANMIVPNSYAQNEYMISRYHWMSQKCRVITNFVDLEQFTPNYKKRGNVPKFIIVGAIAESKNTKNLIEACRLLKAHGQIISIDWYGWTDSPTAYMYDCQRLITEYQLHDYITLKDKQLDIASKYQEAEYFCIPSIYEGTPNVLCEAIASGLPVVGSSVCDNRLYIKDGINGFLFDPFDPQSIVDSLLKIISISDAEYEEFCQHSREIAEDKLSDQTFVNKYINILGNE